MMAMYFHGNSEIQGSGDGLQTLILMNPAYGGYSDTGGSNFVFLNSNSAGATVNLSDAPPSQTQHFTATTSASTSSPQDSHHQDVSVLHTFQNIQYSFYNPPIDIGAAHEDTRGLSLSLSSQQPLLTAGEVLRVQAESPSSACWTSTLLLSSKYLKAAQELLDEAVNVGNNGQPKNIGESLRAAAGVPGNAKPGTELTTAEKQEIQMKKAKLFNMLDELEQRYKKYDHQIQIIISSFEQVAGAGSAKAYTSLALQTISKQFRCLKDTILGQIRAASRRLGDKDDSGGKTGGSKLKYARQQRTLQQLGMIQHNAWRPQRGLPERSVSVLRAWLFEHFLHPYPKDSDKIMLAKQTGLTRSQVSNWFINARVRLWKPMVEDMYNEEIKQLEADGSDDHKTAKTEQNKVSTSKPTKTKPHDKSFMSKQDSPIDQNIDIIGSSKMETITESMNTELKQKTEGFALTGTPTNFIGLFESYPMVEFGRYGPEQFQESYSSNSVSLTLGLQHPENVSISGAHQTFLPNQSIGKDVGIVEANDFSEYEDISIQNRKNFAAQFVT